MLPKFSVQRPYTVLVAVILVIVLGIVSFSGLNTDLLPDIELPYVVVITSYPGASPEQVEQSVTRPLESALGTAGGLKNISSTSNENSSIIMLEFVQTVNMDSVIIDLSNNLDMVSAQLDSAVSKPMILRINPDMMPIMVATVSMENGNIDEVTRYVSDTLLPAFERIDGVGSVSSSGLLEKKLWVSLDQEKIAALNGRVMEDLEEGLDETRLKLTDARAELSSARKKLEGESAKQQIQLSEASAQLDSVIANLQALLAEEALLDAQKAAFEQEKAGLSQLAEFNAVFNQVFPHGVASLAPELYAALMAQMAPQLPEELAELSQDEMAELEAMAAAAPARIAAIETELHNISIRQLTLGAMKPGLEAGLKEAQAGYQQLETGKITLTMELTRAKVQLDSGLDELEKGLSELEAARDDLRGQADLHRIITADTVSNILKAQNFTMPAGYIQEGDEDHLVKVVGRYDSEEALQDTILFSLESVGDIRLSDVADVAVVDNAAQTYAKVNGNDCVIVTFQKQSTASTTYVTEKIHDTIDSLSKHKEGLHILVLMDQGEYINLSISSVLQNLIFGGVLALLVLILFLMDYRPTLVIAFSIPISLMFALTLMYFSNVSLNIISLSGLALGVGMLVDNSIVVIENIYRLRKEGVAVYRAAVVGARQVSGAIFASTLTTVCVFLPIVFTQGLSRQLFTDMGLTIAFSLLASLAVALTLVPTLATTVLKSTEVKGLAWFEALVGGYERVLRFFLKRKVVVIGVVVFLFGLSIYGITIMGTSFLPQMDSPQMSATLTLPEERDPEDLYTLSDEVLARILEIPDVSSVGAMSGGVGGMGMGMGRGTGDVTFFILLQDDRTLTNREVERMILERTEDLEVDLSVSSSDMDVTALGGSGIQVVIKGNDLDSMAQAAEEVAGLLRNTEGVAAAVTGLEDAGTETRILVDRDAAMREGLTAAQVYQKIAEALAVETRSTTLVTGQEEYPVVVVSPDRGVITRENIGALAFSVTGQDGVTKEVLLEDIAVITEGLTPGAIRRVNQSRQITVSASLAEGYNIGLVSRDFAGILASYTPPEGVLTEIAGENVMIAQALRDILLMVALAVLFIYLIMVAQFQSLLSPFIILFTLPLAFTGGLLLLWVSGMPLSVTAMLGFLVLAGIVVNNGIVFVDYVNQQRLEGRDKVEALIETGKARIRPILMTAFTTILAMSTIALGYGSGAEMTQPTAVVTIGGLAYATLLTLVVVPVMYDLLHRRPLEKISVEDEVL